MLRPIVLFGSTIRAWWRELLFLLVLNLIWLLAQVTVILGPPATAALFAVAARVVGGELVGFDDFWRAGREHLAHAWGWGALQVLVYGVLGFNLLAYAGAPGLWPLTLRYTWTILLLLWFTANLYYWPLYLAQHDRRLQTTYGNAARMILLNPGFSLVYLILVLLLVGVSILSGLLLGAVLGVWLALWGTLVVNDRLALRP